MGLFDKIKDNAKTISIKAIEDAQRDGGRAPQVNSSYTESNQDNVYRPSYDEVTEQINVRMTDKPVVSPQTYGVTPEGMYDNNDPSDSTPYIERLGNIDMPQKVGQPDFMSNNDLPYDQELSYDESASYQTEDYLDGKSEPRAVDKPDSGKSEQSKVVAAKSSIPQNSATNSQPTPPSDANQSKNDETIIKPNSESSAKSAISTKQAAPTSSQDSQTSSQDAPSSTNSSSSSAGRKSASSSSASGASGSAISVTSRPSTNSTTVAANQSQAASARNQRSAPSRPMNTNQSPANNDVSPKYLDVSTSQRDPERAKKLVYARERAAIATLAAQRRMTGAVPFYTTMYMNFKIRVFIDRVEYIGSFGKNVIPMDTVAWVKLRAGGTGMIIETKDNRRIVMVVKPADRIDLADSIIEVQEMQPKRVKNNEDKSLRLDYLDKVGIGIDELEKLASLQEKGIITKDEFEAKKKQILDL